MNINPIRSAEARAAVDALKKSTSRKFDYGVSFDIPKEFIEKREYMQSKEFIKDLDNDRMIGIIDEMMKYRDSVKKEIDTINGVIRDKFTQAVNGFARLTHELDKDYSLNFSETETLKTPSQIQYRLFKQRLLPNIVKLIKETSKNKLK